MSNDPVELVVFDFLDALVRKEVREVVDDSTAELTDLYIIESQFITFFRRKLMKERINKVMSDAIDDLLCESFVNAAIERIIEGIAEPLALLCAEEEFFERESEEIEKGFEQYVMRDILDGLLDTINERLQDKNLEFIADQAMKYNKFKDFTEDFLNEVIMFDDEK